MSKLRIALVVQRYGLEVNGGSERLCRMIAERLARRFHVEVLTTCAIDYVSWKNEYPPGLAVVNQIPVRRFPVDRPRDPQEFDQFSAWIFSQPHTPEDELHWVRLQGPCSSDFLSYLKANRQQYDGFVFFTYLYLTTCLGLPLVKDRALLVPTAHDELPIYLGIYDQVFRAARRLLFCTKEEQDFVLRRFCLDEASGETVGVGVEPGAPRSPEDFRREFRARLGNSQLITYVGRIDESKGCRTMIDFFSRYLSERPSRDVKLVLIGKAVMPVPNHPSIVHTGFIAEHLKDSAIQASRLLIMPSPYESLSLAVLEAWTMQKPVLVNGHCEVLRGQCSRSSGGLWYSNYEEFRECFDRLLTDDALCWALGNQGFAHTLQNYTWERVDERYSRALSQLPSCTGAAPVLGA